ncbi:DNA polymerase alpha subunit B [Zancudomyces culisetae]|uniref:DNA polymerase alpha subunit B n=1 Tax=Zancudomyces culisetae TaxID=1213189 RepID=A0A1R1PZ18_ZANCU|nr:DNA polymerase alpha subunit B [Zancudomyces culisetae]|eukprot:OMH86186.1 DNA polymerase alpha subunit B [Zancudomyces culisetae]
MSNYSDFGGRKYGNNNSNSSFGSRRRGQIVKSILGDNLPSSLPIPTNLFNTQYERKGGKVEFKVFTSYNVESFTESKTQSIGDGDGAGDSRVNRSGDNTIENTGNTKRKAKTTDIKAVILSLSSNSANNAAYRYMMENIADKLAVLDHYTDNFAVMTKARYSELITTLSNPSYPHQEPVYIVGRIHVSGGKAVELVSSRRLGNGKSIPLDLSNLDSYSVFPGMNVCVLGTNLNGSMFTAQKLLPPPIPTSITPGKNGAVAAFDTEIMVGCGPFTLNSDLSFGPLVEFVDVALEKNPAVVVLVGPFVSQSHPLIASAPISPSECFTTIISPLLHRLCESRKVILVPSVDDLVSPYFCFPQPPLDSAGLKIPNDVLVAPNPAHILINDSVLVTVCSNDVLMNLSATEVSKNCAGSRLDRLASFILEQGSLFPVSSSNISYSLANSLLASGFNFNLIDEQLPNILITPSALKPFCSTLVDGRTLFLNPGRLSLGSKLGFFASINLRHQGQDLSQKMDADPDTTQSSPIEYACQIFSQ